MMLHSGFKPIAAGHTRPAGARVRPFTASKQAVRPSAHARAAEAVAEEAPAEYAPLVVDDDVLEERVILDDEDKLAVRVAEELLPSFALEAVLEGTMDSAVTSKADALVEDALDSSRGQLSSTLDAAATVLAAQSDAIEITELEDYQGAAGFRKYDEEEDALLPGEADAIQGLKLTRQELSNLVPKDWATTNIDWFGNSKEDNIPLPEYRLNFLWQENNIAVAVDQVYSRGQVSPLTEYFVWPRNDAWEAMKNKLEATPFVAERERVLLLNRLTEVINFWQVDREQDPNKPVPTCEEARAKFPDCMFA